MKSLKGSGGMLIRTAYGMRSPNEINYTERAEIAAKVNGCLSIRGKNPKEFAKELDKLIKKYE